MSRNGQPDEVFSNKSILASASKILDRRGPSASKNATFCVRDRDRFRHFCQVRRTGCSHSRCDSTFSVGFSCPSSLHRPGRRRRSAAEKGQDRSAPDSFRRQHDGRRLRSRRQQLTRSFQSLHAVVVFEFLDRSIDPFQYSFGYARMISVR